jgi:glycosyltransferase involved in cell wall biosynthesis
MQNNNSVEKSYKAIKDRPLISFVITQYGYTELKEYLDAIFSATLTESFEVVISDDNTSDGSWELACSYASNYQGCVTLARHKSNVGNVENAQLALLMSKGEYVVEMKHVTDLDSIFSSLTKLRAEEYSNHPDIIKNHSSNILPTNFSPRFESKNEEQDEPLVSICIYNYNYGEYLRECLDSVFAQSYQNIELCFSDNASTDDSWNIVLEYAERFPGRINLIRNRQNFGAHLNLWNCFLTMKGKYMIKLCSDDVMEPDYISLSVAALEKYSQAAYVMVHRRVLDKDGACVDEPPFYESSCLIPGDEQAAVYMMSSVNPSVSQVIYRVSSIADKRMAGVLNDRWFGDRIMDFHICCESPIIYINKPLLRNRVHDKSDGSNLDDNILQCLGEYVLVNQLADIAKVYPNGQKAVSRLPETIEKLGRLCLRYCLRMLIHDNERAARRYYHLSIALFPEIVHSDFYNKLAQYWDVAHTEKSDALQKLAKEYAGSVSRSHSYPIPNNAVVMSLYNEK